MQIKRIEIQNFGRFQNQTFNLQAGLQVIYGLNETGKTTLHRFISGVLFGFPKARDTQRADQNDGGVLILEFEGQTYRVARYVNKAIQLSVENLTSGEQALDPEKQLQTLLKPLNKQLYQAIYSFNQDDLLKIYTLDPTELNEVLRSVGYPGTDEWLTNAKKLQRQASQQFGKTKTSKRPLNQALRQLRELQQHWNRLMQKAPDVQQLQQRQIQLRADLAALQQRQAQEQVDLQVQNKLQLQVPMWEKIQRLKKEIQANPNLLDASRQTDVETTLQKLQLLADSSDERQEQFKQFQQAMHALRQIQQRGQTVHENIRQLEAMLRQLREKWQPDSIPAPLTVAQLKSLHAHRLGAQRFTTSGNTTNAQKGAGLIGVLGLLLVLLGQWSLLGGVLMVSAGLYWGWRYWQHRTTDDQQISLPGYENWDVATIELVQPDAQQQALWQQQWCQLKEEEEQLIVRQQKVLTELRNLSRQPQADVQQLQKIHAKWQMQVQVQQTTQVQRQEYQALLQSQLNQLGLADVKAYRQRKLVDQRTRALQTQLQTLEQQLGDVDQATLAQFSALHPAHADTAEEQKASGDEASDKQAQQLQAELARVNYELAAFETDTSLETLNQKIATQRSLLQNEMQKYFVEQLSATWIQQTVEHLTQMQLPQLFKVASGYLQRLTQQKYIQIVDQQGQLKLKDQSTHFWTLDEVSRGTAELVYVTLRLAYAWQLKAQWIGPVLIDDAFVDLDASRRQILFEILAEFAAEGYQILYFTAHDNLTLQPTLDLN